MSKFITVNNLNRFWQNGVLGVKRNLENRIDEAANDISTTHQSINKLNSNLNEISNNLEEVKTSFRDGCDTIVAGCTTYGSTPTSNSPDDIVNAIKTIYDNAKASAEPSIYTTSTSSITQVGSTQNVFSQSLPAGTYIIAQSTRLDIGYTPTWSISSNITLLKQITHGLHYSRIYKAALPSTATVSCNVYFNDYNGNMYARSCVQYIKIG